MLADVSAILGSIDIVFGEVGPHERHVSLKVVSRRGSTFTPENEALCAKEIAVPRLAPPLRR